MLNEISMDTVPETEAQPDMAELPEEEIPLPEAPEEEPQLTEEVKVTEPSQSSDATIDEWEDILSIIEKTCPLIAGVLQGSKAYISGDYLLIDTENSQFRSLVNGSNPIYRNSIRNAAEQVLGKVYKLGPYKKAPTESEDPLASFAAKLKELEK